MKIFPITYHYVSWFASIQTDNKNKDKKEKWNSIVLKPLNPNVGLEDDTVKRKLFPTDEKFHELVCSDKFKELIQTDASTEEGQQRVAEYYDVKEAWEKSMASQNSNDDMSPSDTYYQLLKAVKCVSKRDNVWISFYDGLHRHSALILSLLSTTVNMRENNLTHKSLTSTYFKEHHLANYVDEEESPDARLSAIFKKNIEAKMITNKFRVRGLIPKQLGNEVHESKVHLLKDKARQFTEKIVKYSQIISEGKKTSADNSLPSLLMKAFKKSLLNSTPSQRNYKPSEINCESTGVATKPASPSLADKLLYNKTNWNVEPKYTILKDVTPGNHKTKMDQAGDDELKAYGWCNLLNTQEWKEYIRNPLNDSSRAAFIAKMTNSAVHPEAYPIVEKMAKDLQVSVNDLIANATKTASIKLEQYITPEIGLLSLKDIIKELEKPGLDPRKAAKIFEFDPTVKTIKDLKTGMILPGIVNNITNFGCFVDLGIKESGLVHISQLKTGFVSDVNEVVQLHQHVTVKVIEVDEDRKRIQLTLVL